MWKQMTYFWEKIWRESVIFGEKVSSLDSLHTQRALTPDDTVPGIQNCFPFPLITFSPGAGWQRSETAHRSGGGILGGKKQLTRPSPRPQALRPEAGLR